MSDKSKPEGVCPHHASHPSEGESLDLRAPFTRRTFMAATGAAAAAAMVLPGATARAALHDGDLSSEAILRIHPAIGFARLGNADAADFFVGPEVPGYGPVYDHVGSAVPDYKTGEGKVKRQAARFRVWEYRVNDVGDLTPIREVNLATPGVADIKWTVHLANKKASFYQNDGGTGEGDRPPAPLRNGSVVANREENLEIDFGPRTVGAGETAEFIHDPDVAYPATVPMTSGGAPVIDYLGELRTDDKGRLVVIPGSGAAGYNTVSPPPLPHWANNDGWFDDAADGPVTATVVLKNGGGEVGLDLVGAAWVMCGPPDMAPGIPGSITGYDLLLDVAVRHIDLPTNDAAYLEGGALYDLALLKAAYDPSAVDQFPDFNPRFGEHIQPILVAAYNLWWVNGLVTHKHDSLINENLGEPGPASANARSKVFGYMRPPLGVSASTGQRTMPKIFGDDPYLGNMPDAVKRMALTPVQFGMLRRWANGDFTPEGYTPSPDVTPHGLDRAALENTVGGSFFPGIEFGFQLRNPELFAEPFRLDPGAFSGYHGEVDVPVGPGHFSRQMAVPWHADFNDCRNEGGVAWWPAVRPTEVLPSVNANKRVDWARPNNRFEGKNRVSTREDMLHHWHKFGFVLEEGDIFVERERATQIP